MAESAAGRGRVPNWVGAVAPLALIAILLGLFLAFNPIGALRPIPPIESLTVERTVIDPGEVSLSVRNDGPDPVTVAQVLVNDAYWDFSVGDATLGRLEATRIDIFYPWEEGLPLNIAIVTSTGVTIEHEIEAAALTPDADATTFGIYALLGVYIGVIPVAIGLLWFGALKRARPRWIAFFLALTVGLLVFLLIDTIEEGLEIAAGAGAFNGVGLFGIGALGAIVGLFFLEGAIGRARSTVKGLFLAYLVATGIGLHNLGEGLAVGAALAAGEIALGTFLIVGFALHNTTEGLAIVAPLGGERRRPSLWHFVALGALAGAPTIAGAWLGGFAFSPAYASLAFGVAAGAIAQVVWTIGRSVGRERGVTSGVGALGFVAGLAVMYVTGLLTA